MTDERIHWSRDGRFEAVCGAPNPEATTSSPRRMRCDDCRKAAVEDVYLRVDQALQRVDRAADFAEGVFGWHDDDGGEAQRVHEELADAMAALVEAKAQLRRYALEALEEVLA